ELVVAAKERRDRLAIGHVNQELARSRLLDPKELADFTDRPLVRRRYPLVGGEARGGTGRRVVLATDLGALLVGRLAAAPAVDDLVLARGAGNHEFVGGIAADRPTLGLDDDVRESTTIVNAAIGLVHRLVAGIELIEIRIDAIGVLHQEFAGPDDPEPGSR